MRIFLPTRDVGLSGARTPAGFARDESRQQVGAVLPPAGEALVLSEGSEGTLLQLGCDDGRNLPRDDVLTGVDLDLVGARVGALVSDVANRGRSPPPARFALAGSVAPSWRGYAEIVQALRLRVEGRPRCDVLEYLRDDLRLFGHHHERAGLADGESVGDDPRLPPVAVRPMKPISCSLPDACALELGETGEHLEVKPPRG